MGGGRYLTIVLRNVVMRHGGLDLVYMSIGVYDGILSVDISIGDYLN